jgi:hypothetical protein
VYNRGIRTSDDGIEFCLASIGDALSGSVPYQLVNAGLRAYGHALRTDDTANRYGRETTSGRKLLDFRKSRGEVVDQGPAPPGNGTQG